MPYPYTLGYCLMFIHCIELLVRRKPSTNIYLLALFYFLFANYFRLFAFSSLSFFLKLRLAKSKKRSRKRKMQDMKISRFQSLNKKKFYFSLKIRDCADNRGKRVMLQGWVHRYIIYLYSSKYTKSQKGSETFRLDRT